VDSNGDNFSSAVSETITDAAEFFQNGTQIWYLNNCGDYTNFTATFAGRSEAHGFGGDAAVYFSVFELTPVLLDVTGSVAVDATGTDFCSNSGIRGFHDGPNVEHRRRVDERRKNRRMGKDDDQLPARTGFHCHNSWSVTPVI
jgi:hypothetical protein